MNPFEGKSAEEVLRLLKYRIENGDPWSYLQEVLSYYRPDLNNKEFYDWVGYQMDQEYDGDWTNEDLAEDFDYAQEPEWDQAFLENREFTPEEIEENIRKFKEGEKSKPDSPVQKPLSFGFMAGDSSPYDARMREWSRITDTYNTSLTVESDPEDVRILTEDYENRANKLINDPLSDKEWSAWSEFTNKVRQVEQERDEKKAKKKPASSEKSYFDSPDNLTNKRSVITSSQPPAPEQMEQSIYKLSKQKFTKPGIFQ
jgi:hypothetical protein